jgi:hypothetical protein
MVAVRTHCLSEYVRIWGHPWDNTWPDLHQHILKMRETAKKAHAVWSRLRGAVRRAVDFVETEGLPVGEEVDGFRIAGKTVHESVTIHDWLHGHLDAVEELLDAEDFEKVHAPRSNLAELLGRKLVPEPALPVGTIRWNTGGERGRELTEREMAYISLLVENEPPSLKRRLQDELVSIENVIEMEREAINAARVRHDEVKREELAERTAARACKPASGERRAKGRPRHP